MFDWREFFGALAFLSVIVIGVAFITSGFYLLCEKGNIWGFAMVVAGSVIGVSIAVGFGL